MHNKRKKVCFFSSLYPPHLGGVERLTDLLAQKLALMDWQVSVVTSNTHALAESEISNGVKLFRLPVLKLMDSRFPLPIPTKKSFSLLKEVSNEEPDIIVVNMRFYPLSLLGMCFAKKHRKPLVSYEHVSGHFTVNNPIFDWIGRAYEHFASKLMKKNTDMFLSVSKSAGEWLRHFGIDCKGIVYNCIDETSIANYLNENQFEKNSTRKTIVYAGRILKEKGLLDLVDAFLYLKNDLDSNQKKYVQNLYLFIAGDGPLLPFLQKKLKNNSDIKLTGQLNYQDTINLIAKCDIYILPSYYPEGLPTTLLEAGILKKPVITSAMGGTEELIEHGINGIIIKTHSQEEISNAIMQLLENPDFASQLANNLFLKVKNEFSAENSAKNLGAYLEELIC